MRGRDGGIGDSGGQIVGASQGSLEKVRNTKCRRMASARGDRRLVLQGRRSRGQAGRMQCGAMENCTVGERAREEEAAGVVMGGGRAKDISHLLKP
jgi:hypothetical protein